VAGGIDKDALEIRAPLPATSKNGEVEKLEDLDGDIDDLANALGGIGLSSVKTCIVCTKDLLPGSWNEAEGRYCKGCKYEIELYAGLQFSTKIKKTIELLEQIQEKREDGAKKSIIFSQFTQFFDLLVPFLKRAGIKYVMCEYEFHIVFLHVFYSLCAFKDTGAMKKYTFVPAT
jgi:SNF2 family DNA or RNA helicase